MMAVASSAPCIVSVPALASSPVSELIAPMTIWLPEDELLGLDPQAAATSVTTDSPAAAANLFVRIGTPPAFLVLRQG
jgi:hypothetical protein